MTTNYITNALALLETYAKMIDGGAPASSTSDALRRFEGNGVPFRAKLIGMEDIQIDRDEKLCLDSMFKLKAVAKARGEHKQRVQLQLTVDSVKMIDEQTKTQVANHEIERISFVVLDPKDNRAFGYVYNTTDDRHQFWAVKTEKTAALTVATLKELFDLAFEVFNQKQKSAAAPTEAATSDPNVDSTKENNEAIAAPKTENPPNTTNKNQVENLFDLSTPVEPVVNQPPPQPVKAPILIDDIFGDLNLNTAPTPVNSAASTTAAVASPFVQPNVLLNATNPIPSQTVYVQPNVAWNMASPTPIQTGFAQPNVTYNMPNATVTPTGYIQPGVPSNVVYPGTVPTGFIQPVTMPNVTHPEVQQPIYPNVNTRQQDPFNVLTMPPQNVTLANSHVQGVDSTNSLIFASQNQSAADLTSSGNSFSSSSFDPMSPGPATVPSVPPTFTNPMSSFDMFNLLSGPAARPTRDNFFPNQPPPKTIQQLQMEKNS